MRFYWIHTVQNCAESVRSHEVSVLLLLVLLVLSCAFCVDADGLRRRGVVDDDDFMVLFFLFFSVNQSAEYHVRVVCRHVVERFISVLLWHPSPIF